MRTQIRAIALATTAAAVLAAPSAAIAKTPKKPKAPSAATIKKLLAKAYCAPNENISHKVVESVVVTMKSVKRGKPRLGRYFFDGVDPNTKTWVFPIKAAYLCDYTTVDGSYAATDLSILGEYTFFKNSFREWTFKGGKHDAQRVPA